MTLLRNPMHNFGYINLPGHIEVKNAHGEQDVFLSPFALIEREIHKSEVDVIISLPGRGNHYFGKAVELRTAVGQRYLRLDTTWCQEDVFSLVRGYVEENRPVYQHRPYLVSMHIDTFIKEVHLVSSTVEEDGLKDTVLNMVVITLG